jgi:adenosylmethionine-8-amino-7-oxononanoate aminotransferase
MGAMSICDPVGGMHHLFGRALPRQIFARRPPPGEGVDPGWEAHARELAARHSREIAAVVAEPVVQGAGGMWFYDPGYVRSLREIADEHGFLLVLDEIATGFGRTGPLFAAEAAGVTPDVMCVGKAMTGGYLTQSAMLCTAKVAQVVSGGEAGCLMHGPTYMANPLACSVALASIGLLASGQWQQDVRRIEAELKAVLAPARSVACVKDVRVLGAIGVIELDHPVDVAAAVSGGVWIRPFRDLIYTMPPYVTTGDDIEAIGAAMVAAATAG